MKSYFLKRHAPASAIMPATQARASGSCGIYFPHLLFRRFHGELADPSATYDALKVRTAAATVVRFAARLGDYRKKWVVRYLASALCSAAEPLAC